MVRNHGDPADVEVYIPDPAGNHLATMACYHHAKCCLAIALPLCPQVRREKVAAGVGRIGNTVLDSDCLTLLAFANAIATDEIEGMARLCRWMYGDHEKVIDHRTVQSLKIPESEIEMAAYRQLVGA